ncbi:MAG: polysaccharide biosynthesis/export family protein [Salinivirgaceae bacterium]|nr:polysaccharide biosynthesis/export family protein [Salinivirgaceae bacterium]
MNRAFKLVAFIAIAIVFSSCSVRYKNLVYVQDLYKSAPDTLPTTEALKIVLQPNDNLYISLVGANSETLGLHSSTDRFSNTVQMAELDAYLVDANGDINFPVVGKIHLAGLTLGQATDTVQSRIDEYVTNVVATVRLLNYKVTVLGEVSHPGTYTFTDREISIFDALGKAGDCTVYADRSEIMILRKGDNTTSTATLNMKASDFISDPNFWLKSNDVVYVKPTRARTWPTNSSLLSVFLSSISVVTTVLVLFKD